MTQFIITSIEPQKRFPNRRNIYLGEAFAFGLDEEVVLKHHLHEGDTLTDEMIRTLLIAEEKARVRQKALALLAYRARSIGELRDRLLQTGYDEPVIEDILSDLTRVGLLNDDAFADAYVQTRMIQRPASKSMLIYELKQKHVDESTAVRAIERSYENRTETAVAMDLIRSRLNRYRHLDSRKIQKRISDFLTRRGFGWEVVGEIVLWAQIRLDENEDDG